METDAAMETLKENKPVMNGDATLEETEFTKLKKVPDKIEPDKSNGNVEVVNEKKSSVVNGTKEGSVIENMLPNSNVTRKVIYKRGDVSHTNGLREKKELQQTNSVTEPNEIHVLVETSNEISVDDSIENPNLKSIESEVNGMKDHNSLPTSRECTPLSDVSGISSVVSRSDTPVNTDNNLNENCDTQKLDRNVGICRSSEERSMDSVDSAGGSVASSISSTKSAGPFKKGVPRARKSGPPASKNSLPHIIKQEMDSSLVKNVTLNLPDFENPIRINSKMLDEISKLGKNNVKRDCKKIRTSLPLKVEPKVSPVPKETNTEGHFSDSSLLEKDAFGKIKKRKRKRARLGTYKLPNELKKKTQLKKKEESSADVKEETNVGSSGTKEICEKNESISSPVSKTSNEKSPVGKSEVGSPRSAFDVMKRARITPRTKNTLGSTRQRSSLGKSKAQSSLDNFLNLAAETKPVQEVKAEVILCLCMHFVYSKLFEFHLLPES